MQVSYQPSGYSERALVDVRLSRFDVERLSLMLADGGSALVTIEDEAVVVVMVEDE